MKYLNEVEDYVKGFMKHAGHSYSHVRRVYTLADRVSERMKGVDKSVLLTAALLHDIARAYEDRTGECHARVGSEWAGNYLQRINYPSSKIPRVVNVIKTHRYSNGDEPDTIEGRILQECDRLDAMGAIGVIRTTLHNVDNEPYHASDPLARNREVDDHVYGLDHFFFKLFKLKDTITLPVVKEYAVKRHEFMLEFLDQVEEDLLHNGGGEGVKLISLIREYHELPYYNEVNPFQEGDDTLVGRILERDSNGFIKNFINELESEIL